MIWSVAILAATNSDPKVAVSTVPCSFVVPMSRSGIHKVQACSNCPPSDLIMM